MLAIQELRQEDHVTVLNKTLSVMVTANLTGSGTTLKTNFWAYLLFVREFLDWVDFDG